MYGGLLEAALVINHLPEREVPVSWVDARRDGNLARRDFINALRGGRDTQSQNTGPKGAEQKAPLQGAQSSLTQTGGRRETPPTGGMRWFSGAAFSLVY